MNAAGLGICDNETVLVSSGENVMPTTLALKNIPDAVDERLKAAAEAHRRSLNSEAIACLEADPAVGETWMAEVRRRDEQIESGTGQAIPGETALARLRARLR